MRKGASRYRERRLYKHFFSVFELLFIKNQIDCIQFFYVIFDVLIKEANLLDYNKVLWK